VDKHLAAAGEGKRNRDAREEQNERRDLVQRFQGAGSSQVFAKTG
jgi:hypothetical protein